MEEIRMVVALPKVKVGKKMYFFDERLKQLRNVRNPHDFIDLDDFETEYYKEQAAKEPNPRLKGKTLKDEDKDKYDWSRKIFMGVTKKCVYYRLPKIGSDEMENVKLFYDRMQDWEFEY
jgi:hypothetical protein